MAKLVPVDDDPFAQDSGAGSTLTPVDHNPFVTVEDRAAPPSAWDRFLTGAADVPMGIYQMGLHAPMIDNVLVPVPEAPPDYSALEAKKFDAYLSDREQKYQADRKAGGQDGIDWMRMGGNVAATLPLSAIGGAAAPVRAATLGGKALVAAGEGAIGSVLNPVTEGDYAKGKAEQLATGTVGGAVAERLGAAAGKIIKPTFDKAQTLLMSEGVRLTPGQMIGGGGKVVEDAMTSAPLTGNALSSGMKRSLSDFNKAGYNRALAPIGEKFEGDKVGREGIKQVGERLSAAYEKVIPNLTFKADQEFKDSVANLRSMAEELPQDQARQFDAIIGNRLDKRLGETGEIDGQTYKQVESELGRKAADLHSSEDAAQRQLGDAIGEVQGAMRDGLERSNPEAAGELRKINAGWAAFTRLQRAAGNRSTSGGVFTPGDLLTAVKRSDKSVRKGSFARGDALLQDLADAGQEVLSSKVPDSGTATRSAVTRPLEAALNPLTWMAPVAAMTHSGTGMNLLRAFAGVAPATAGVVAKGQQNTTRNAIAQLMARLGTASAVPAGQVAAGSQGVPPRLPMGANLPIQPGPPQ